MRWGGHPGAMDAAHFPKGDARGASSKNSVSNARAWVARTVAICLPYEPLRASNGEALSQGFRKKS